MISWTTSLLVELLLWLIIFYLCVPARVLLVFNRTKDQEDDKSILVFFLVTTALGNRFPVFSQDLFSNNGFVFLLINIIFLGGGGDECCIIGFNCQVFLLYLIILYLNIHYFYFNRNKSLTILSLGILGFANLLSGFGWIYILQENISYFLIHVLHLEDAKKKKARIPRKTKKPEKKDEISDDQADWR